MIAKLKRKSKYIEFMRKINQVLKLFYLMMIVSTLAWLLWPPNAIRIVIVLYHAVYWLATFRLRQLAKMLSKNSSKVFE